METYCTLIATYHLKNVLSRTRYSEALGIGMFHQYIHI